MALEQPQQLEGKGMAGGKRSAGFEDNVTEFTLPNGMHFIVLARNEAPTVSCQL
jgi:hypothetical protein